MLAAGGCVLADDASVNAAPIAAALPADQSINDRSFNLLDGLILAIGVVSAVLVVWRKWWRLDGPVLARRAAPLRPEISLLLFGLMLIAGYEGATLAAWVCGISPGGTQPATQPAIVELEQSTKLALGAYISQGAVAIAALVLKRRVANGRFPRLGPVVPASPSHPVPFSRSIVLGIFALIVVWPMAEVLTGLTAALVEWMTERPTDAIAHSTLRAMVDSPRGFWMLASAALAVVAAPMMEEMMYRGLLQDGLAAATVPRWGAMAITSGVFVLMHVSAVPLPGLVGLFVLSLGFGWCYVRTGGRLMAGITMHAVFNAANLAMALAMD